MVASKCCETTWGSISCLQLVDAMDPGYVQSTHYLMSSPKMLLAYSKWRLGTPILSQVHWSLGKTDVKLYREKNLRTGGLNQLAHAHMRGDVDPDQWSLQ